MFCSQCGTQVGPAVNFCTRCGARINNEPAAKGQQVYQQPQQTYQQAPPAQQPVYQQAPPAQQPVYQQTPPVQQQVYQQAGTVSTLWAISAFEKISMFKSDQCYLIFMTDRMVIDYMTKERVKWENEKLTNEVRQSDMGFFKKSAAMMSYWSNYAKKYSGMTPEQILALSPQNKVVWNASVSQFIFHCYSQQIDDDSTTSSSGGTFTIVLTNGEKLKFSHKEVHHKTSKEFLTNYFGNRLKYRK